MMQMGLCQRPYLLPISSEGRCVIDGALACKNTEVTRSNSTTGKRLYYICNVAHDPKAR